MPDVGLAPVASGAAGRFVDRRTLLVGAGAFAAAGLGGPAHAAGHALSLTAGPRFDPGLAHELQRALHTALRDPIVRGPGAVLHIRTPKLGAWTGVAGLGRVAPDVPMRRADRFRAGSIVKPFVSVVVLQLAERGRVSLDARLPAVLPAEVVARFPTAADITVRMLLGHRSGLPEWDTPAVDEQFARGPAKVWKVSEFLDLAAAQPPVFAPGTGFFYSNTNYNLLGLIIERITGRSWRHAVTRRVVRPLRLSGTDLPAPETRRSRAGTRTATPSSRARRSISPAPTPRSSARAGASALVTTVQDLARFLDALFRGRLFRHRATLRQMLDRPRRRARAAWPATGWASSSTS